MSSFVMVSPEVLSAASSDMSGIGSAVRSAHAFAAGSTTSVLAAAGDEVSAAVSELFDGYAREYQAVAAQAALFHEQFVQALTAGGRMYAAAEAASADPLTSLVGAVQNAAPWFSPVQLLTGRPLER